jgi:hypothetical protein
MQHYSDMHQFLTAKPKAHPTSTQQPPKGSSHTAQANAVPNTSKEQTLSTEIFTGYLSDLSDDLPQLEDDVNILVDSEDEDSPSSGPLLPLADSTVPPNFPIQKPPPLKHHCLDVPSRIARQKAREECCTVLQHGLLDIEKIIVSTKTNFVSGHEELQAY